MDRRTILERLDIVRPGSNDLALPELATARQALRDDPEIAEEFERRQFLDRQTAHAMRDVPVPEGLRVRLLETLATADQIDPGGVTRPAEKSLGWNRRGVLAMVASIAVSLFAGGIYWSFNQQAPTPLTVAQVEQAAGCLLSGEVEAVPFEGNFQPQLPQGHWRRLRLTRAVFGLLPSASGHRAAGWRFTYGRSSGVLVMVPRNAVSNPPDHGRHYAGGSSIAWTEGDFVYICRVNGRIENLLDQIGHGRLA